MRVVRVSEMGFGGCGGCGLVSVGLGCVCWGCNGLLIMLNLFYN